MLKALAPLLVSLCITPATALPIDGPPVMPAGTESGFLNTWQAQTLSFAYDVGSDLLTYQSDGGLGGSGDFIYLQGPEGPRTQVTSRFVWDLTVNDVGAVTKKGSAALYLDVGDGLGLKKAIGGTVFDLGSSSYGCRTNADADATSCFWVLPKISFKVNFENPDFFQEFSVGDWMLFNGSFGVGTVGTPPLTQGFSINIGEGESGVNFSQHELVGFKVPEPDAYVTMLVGLAAFGLAIRRRKVM